MGLRNSGRSTTACINRHIGSAYDKVALVADNIDDVIKLADALEGSLKYLGASTSVPTSRLNGSDIEDGDYYLDTTNDYLVFYDAVGDVWISNDPTLVTNALNDAIAARDVAQASAATATIKANEASVSAASATASEDYIKSIENSIVSVADFDFDSGGVLKNKHVRILYNNSEYIYIGSGSFPLTVTAGTNPVGNPDWLATVTTNAQSISYSGGGNVDDALTDVILEVDKVKNTSARSGAEWANALSKGFSPSVHCYGDSTMFGASVGDLGTQDPNNAPATLGIVLGLLYGASVVPLNFGISGSTLRGMLAGTDGSGSTFESKVVSGASVGANIIYCNHGINDSQLDLSINQYRADLYEFIRICRDNGRTPILVTPNPNPPILIIDTAKTKRLREFVKVMRSVAAQMDCDLVDQFKYFELTAKMIPMDQIVSDGAHLTSRAYLQAGFNLAIPLVSAATIKNYGDVAGLTNTTFYDNAYLNRRIESHGATCGPTIIFDKEGVNFRGINFPFILEIPSEYITVNHVSWNSGTRIDSKINNEITGRLLNFFKDYGDLSYVDWDAMTDLYIGSKLWCGLNILSLLFDVTYASGNGFAFSGVTLLDKPFSSIVRRDVQLASIPTIRNNSSVFFDAYLTDAGDRVVLVDNNDSEVLALVKESGIIKMQLKRSGVVQHSLDLSTANIPDGTYPVQIDIEQDRVYTILSNIGAALVLDSPLPNLKVKSPAWLKYSVESYS